VRGGIWGLGVTFLGGIWVMLAPVITGAERGPVGPWTAAVWLTSGLGLLVALLSLAGLFGYLVYSLRERPPKDGEEAAPASAESGRPG
jgi:hypothetical protein